MVDKRRRKILGISEIVLEAMLLTKLFAILQPHNPEIDELYCLQKRRF